MGGRLKQTGVKGTKRPSPQHYSVVLAVGEYHAFTNRSKKFHLFVSFRIDVETVFQSIPGAIHCLSTILDTSDVYSTIMTWIIRSSE